MDLSARLDLTRAGRFERRDRSPDGGEETVGPDPGGEARLLEDLALPSLQAGETERDPALLELDMESSQDVDRRGVEVRPRLGVEHQPPDVFGSVDKREHTLSEVLGVDEEGRRIEAVHEQPGHRLGALPARDVVIAVDVVDAAEHGIVRARRAVEEDADRERDRDDDAADDAEHEHAAEGDERERDLGRTHAAEPPDRVDVDQPGGGDDDDHSERRRRQRLDQGHREEEEEPDDRRGDEDGSLGPRAGGVVDRGPGVGGGDGKRPGQAADEVGAADRGQLAVGVDLVAVLLGEGAHGRDQVREGNERECRRGKHEIEEVVCSDPWQPERGQAALDLADDGDPVLLQVDERRDHEREREHHQRRRAGRERSAEPRSPPPAAPRSGARSARSRRPAPTEPPTRPRRSRPRRR